MQREATCKTDIQDESQKIEDKDRILADQEIVNMVKNVLRLSRDTIFTMNELNSYKNLLAPIITTYYFLLQQFTRKCGTFPNKLREIVKGCVHYIFASLFFKSKRKLL